MIEPLLAQDAEAVANHYDELDPIYRQIWGEHVHHGLWSRGDESPLQAVNALADLVGERLELTSGHAVVDIGCGYGATARRLAAFYDATITGLTLSKAQANYAADKPVTGVSILVRDWLHNELPSGAFDRAYSIESSEHMVDKPLFFAEAQRVLRDKGKLVVCAWLAETDASGWKVNHLLEPICREGRLPSMGSREEYEAMARGAGFRVASFEDLSAKVARTWTLCARRLARKLVTDASYVRMLASAHTRNRVFALSLPRLMLAYRTGAMRYGVFVFDKE